MSEPKPKYKVTFWQDDDTPLDEIHCDVHQDGQLLGTTHGRSQVTISFDALRAGSTEVGAGTGEQAGRLQVTAFDRARDVPGPRIALVVCEGMVGEDGAQSRATARRLDTTAIYRRMNQE